MRKTISELFNSIQLALGMVNRVVKATDYLAETAEINAKFLRDGEVLRLKREHAELMALPSNTEA